MTTTTLVAATQPSGPSLVSWAEQISGWSVPGRFAFFVFRIDLPYPCEDWFPGLQLQISESGYYVGGTLDQWSTACYALLNTDSPHDCCDVYRQIHDTLSAFGYSLRGSKTTQAKRFYLK